MYTVNRAIVCRGYAIHVNRPCAHVGIFYFALYERLVPEFPGAFGRTTYALGFATHFWFNRIRQMAPIV